MSARLAVLASGSGSNLQAIIDHFHAPAAELARVAIVISDRPGVRALERAAAAGSEARVVPVAGRQENDAADELYAVLDDARADFVALAGYLRLVPRAVVSAFRGRIINIHPALLPAFGGSGMYGLRVHEAVLAAGCTVSGATVHHVDEAYDRGRIIAQWPVPVLPGDDAATLAARVLRVEHRLYPATLEWLVRRRAAGGDGVADETLRAARAAGFAIARDALPDAASIGALIREGEA